VILRFVTTPGILPEKVRHQPKSDVYSLGSTKLHSFITTQEGDIKMLVTSLRMLPDILEEKKNTRGCCKIYSMVCCFFAGQYNEDTVF
jgi:hypothetical protein